MAMKLEILNGFLKKLNSNHTCLTVVSLDFVLKKDESYYPQGIFMII